MRKEMIILVPVDLKNLNFWTFPSCINTWMHISVLCVSAWTYIKLSVNRLNDLKKKMFHFLDLWTPDDYYLGPIGA